MAWLAALVLACAALPALALPALPAAFLSAGLTEALTRLGAAVDDDDQEQSGSAGTINVTIGTVPVFVRPIIWSLELFGPQGDDGQPAVLFSSDELPDPTVTVATRDAQGAPSRLSFTWRADSTAAPYFILELGSGDDAQALAPGAHDAAGGALLDVLYGLDRCHATARGFDLDALAADASTVTAAVVRFRCGAGFSGVLRYHATAPLDAEWVRLDGSVWQDQDMDGLRSSGPGEPDRPLSGVRVDLLKNGRRVATTLTGSNGNYRFEALYDTYQVAVHAPDGLGFTTRDAGGAEDLDSDVDPATGRSDPIDPGPLSPQLLGGGYFAAPAAPTIGLTATPAAPTLPLPSTRFGSLLPGDRASYGLEGDTFMAFGTDTVLPGGLRLDGSAARDVVDREGNHLWLSNDARGLRLHRARLTLRNGRAYDYAFAPALVLLPGQVAVGARRSSGRVMVRNAAGVATTLRYDYAATVLAGNGAALTSRAGPGGNEFGFELRYTLSFSGALRATMLATSTHASEVWTLDSGLVGASTADGRAHGLTALRRGLGGSVDGNRSGDMLAVEPLSGALGAWRMFGLATPTWQDIAPAGAAGALAARGDVDGDGVTDLVLHDVDSGLVSLVSGAGAPRPLAFAPADERLLTLANLARGAREDILWRNVASGALTSWSPGTSPRIQAHTITIAGGGSIMVGADWTLAGRGDFDADGADDLLWQEAGTGRYAWWFMRGQERLRATLRTLAAPWQLAAVNDFDGDGHADCLWLQPASRQLALWLMDGAQPRIARAFAPAEAGASLVGSGDFDADGAADLLWRDDATDALSAWLLRGPDIRARGALGALPTGFTPLP